MGDSTLTEGSRKNRRIMVSFLVKANGYETIEPLLADIKADKLTVYSASKRLVDSMIRTHSPATVYGYRSMLPGLFQSVLGEENFRKTVFDRLAPCGTVYLVSHKNIPTPDGLRAMLTMANAQYKALIGFLACSGMRIGEVLSRKWSDVEVRPDGYARVTLRAGETKARKPRYAFLTRETVLWLRTFTIWLGVKSEWVFPGENETKALQYGTALEQIKRLFDRNGMKDNGPEIFTPHSFRTFADAQMRKAGLDSKYVSAIIGHVNKLQSEASYLDWTEIEKEWVAKCEQKLTWLADSTLLNRLSEEKNKTANLESLLSMALSPAQIEKLKEFIAGEIKR